MPGPETAGTGVVLRFGLSPSRETRIRRVHDSVVDGYYEKEATQKTGKSVSINEESKPLFLLKNAKHN